MQDCLDIEAVARARVPLVHSGPPFLLVTPDETLRAANRGLAGIAGIIADLRDR
jgi:hypothetical protein